MSKNKSGRLEKLMNAGKAFVYHTRTWKAYVTVILSSPEDVAEYVKEIAGEDESPFGLSGFSLTTAMKSASARKYLMWVNVAPGTDPVPSLAHEAVHISGLILSDCGVSVDLKDISASECLAYLVEDIVRSCLSRIMSVSSNTISNSGGKK